MVLDLRPRFSELAVGKPYAPCAARRAANRSPCNLPALSCLLADGNLNSHKDEGSGDARRWKSSKKAENARSEFWASRSGNIYLVLIFQLSSYVEQERMDLHDA